MNRRNFFWNLAALSVAVAGDSGAAASPSSDTTFRRVRPGSRAWPSDRKWEQLGQRVNGRLLRIQSPLEACRAGSLPCSDVFERLRNPYDIGDDPALTQTLGWADAWETAPSVYAVAAESPSDVVAAVNFARENRLRLVVKGGGHSYQGTSCSADSLLVWTRRMNAIEIHEAFVPQGGMGTVPAQPAVSIGAGAVWMRVYQRVTTEAGRYVQGGGCATVGVAGLIQSGGFGSLSKNYGLAAAALLEAEVVTADGALRIANAYSNPDLFWALKGGGGGTFGVVTRLTLMTRDLPERFGAVSGAIRAKSDEAYRRLVARIIDFYSERLFNPQWGEQVRFQSGRLLRISMLFQGLDRDRATEVWKPFVDWVAASPEDFTWEKPLRIVDFPARHLWDVNDLKQHAPNAIVADSRPGAPEENIFWAGDQGDVGQYLHAYRSAWLPAGLLAESRRESLIDALLAASRQWEVALHFNKGLAGAPTDEIERARDTATNPDVLDAFALVIVAANRAPAFSGVPGHEPDLPTARRESRAVDGAMTALLRIAPDAGSYVSESNYFQEDWQKSFWGPNYDRLAAVKRRYDPDGLFFVHHGVGSEEWSPDGFVRLARN